MKECAYHEAGHAAVKAFFGDDHSHFKGLTIIPTSGYRGVFSQEMVYSFPFDAFKTSSLGWIRGHWRIMDLLAGPIACSLISGKPYDIDTAINEGLGETMDNQESESQWRRIADEGKALSIAEAISMPGLPPFRVLSLSERWTRELIATPAMWATIEKIAGTLLKVGSIIDLEEYGALVSDVLDKWLGDPKWNRGFRFELE